MMSNGVQQGYFAMGSASYVAGAGIGNAIGNAIRIDQFMAQCMTLQGYKRVPKSAVGKQGGGYFPPPPRSSLGKPRD